MNSQITAGGPRQNIEATSEEQSSRIPAASTAAAVSGQELRCVVYISTATELMRPAQLMGLLKSSRARNVRAGITGMLLYRAGSFMQLIEGPTDVVRALIKRIEKDRRHRGMAVIYDRPIQKRSFGEWSMAFQKAEELDPEDQAAVSRYLDDSFNDAEHSPRADRAVLLLQSFKKYMR